MVSKTASVAALATSRRAALGLIAGAGALVASGPVLAKTQSANRRFLSLYNLHTHERLTAGYWENGTYVPSALQEIAHVLRDHRSGEVHAMDPRLLDIVHQLKAGLGALDKPVEIISGYRSPHTNAAMRAAGNRGVAKKSFHMRGMAIDLNITGVPLRRQRQVAIALNAGGVGYYPRSGFVHVDTGQPRSW